MFDVIVVGLGAIGSASVYQLAKRGLKVCGIDKFTPPHNFGSHHGDTRIIRKALGEGEVYVPLVLRAFELWQELEKNSNTKLFFKTGGLVIGHRSNFLEQTVRQAQKFGIEHKLLTHKEIKRLYHVFKVSAEDVGYFEPDAGYLLAEESIKAELSLAKTFGADLILNEEVKRINTYRGRLVVFTDQFKLEAKFVVLCAGAWISSLLAEFIDFPTSVYRQTVFWFDVSECFERFKEGNFPVFIWEREDCQIYGFPALKNLQSSSSLKARFKIAGEQFLNDSSIEDFNRTVDFEEIQQFYETSVFPCFEGVSKKCLGASACAYTVTSSMHFVIDRLAEVPNLFFISACLGHGFKHSIAIAEALADLIEEKEPKVDLSFFKLRT